MKRSVTSLLLLSLAGCCTGPQFMGLAYDPRVEIERRQTYALVSTVLEDPKVWAYGEPTERIKAREAAYRPKLTRTPGRDSVGPISAAPADLALAFAAAHTALQEMGYRPVAAGAQEDFILALSLSWYDDGRLARVAVQIGAELDGRFEPQGISIAAVVSEKEPCPVTVAELVDELVTFLPFRGEEEP